MPARVLVATRLDGHDRGAKSCPRPAGRRFEVIYTGIAAARAIAAVAVQETSTSSGLSIPAARTGLTKKTADALRAAGAGRRRPRRRRDDPREGFPRLEAAGAAAVYPTGSALEALVDSIRTLSGRGAVQGRDGPSTASASRGRAHGSPALRRHDARGPGADVVKVEPLGGDLSPPSRVAGVDGHNVYFASLNRNKRSVHVA